MSFTSREDRAFPAPHGGGALAQLDPYVHGKELINQLGEIAAQGESARDMGPRVAELLQRCSLVPIQDAALDTLRKINGAGPEVCQALERYAADESTLPSRTAAALELVRALRDEKAGRPGE